MSVTDPDGAGADPSTYSPDWLALREPADAAARARDLADAVVTALREAVRAGRRPAGAPVVVHDLGCGSGSMGRWLAPLLPGPQHWVLHDRDPALLGLAASRPGTAPGGATVTVEPRRGVLGALTAADLAGADLVTAAALLGVLTAAEVGAVVAAVAGAGCPALLTLSVLGRVDLAPPDPLDVAVEAAFNAHQRRPVAGRTLLGPAAVEVASAAFDRHGYDVEVRPSPWRLGGADAGLAAAWFDGWAGAAAEHSPDVAPAGYLARRAAAARAGTLHVTVQHADLLARPRGERGRPPARIDG
ncbi:MAG: SAM-dependent methyltransferase [Actinobacteria bacterium]|nr:SAM-dependent methyltransferase [Actinomycetota bacterium]